MRDKGKPYANLNGTLSIILFLGTPEVPFGTGMCKFFRNYA